MWWKEQQCDLWHCCLKEAFSPETSNWLQIVLVWNLASLTFSSVGSIVPEWNVTATCSKSKLCGCDAINEKTQQLMLQFQNRFWLGFISWIHSQKKGPLQLPSSFWLLQEMHANLNDIHAVAEFLPIFPCCVVIQWLNEIRLESSDFQPTGTTTVLSSFFMQQKGQQAAHSKSWVFHKQHSCDFVF